MFNSSPQLGGPVTSENQYGIGIRTIFLPSMPFCESYVEKVPTTSAMQELGSRRGIRKKATTTLPHLQDSRPSGEKSKT